MILFNLILLSGYCFNQTEPIEEIVDEPIAGGIEETSENQWKYLKPTLETVEREMDSQLDSPFVHRVGEVIKSKSQIVAGIRFYIDFNFHQTNCLKTETEKIKNLLVECNELGDAKKCYADIWSQPWLERNELLNFTCMSQDQNVVDQQTLSKI